MLSKFREGGHSPHFSLFYGAYLAIAKDYYYNITEDFSDIRFESWFWKKQKEGLFKFVGFEGETPLPSDDSLMETPDDLSDGSSSSGSSVSELDERVHISDESGSLHSASITTASETSEFSTNSSIATKA